MAMCFFFVLGSSLSATGFIFRNGKVQPVQNSGALSNSDLSSVVFQHQDDIQVLQQDLIRSRQELRDLQQELREYKSEFSQFKNLYFRRF